VPLVSATDTITAREFVPIFDEGWHAPGSAEGLLAYFGPYLDPAVHMSGPLSPDCHGIHQVTEFFELLFAVIGDLHGGVESFEVESEDVVHLRVRLRGTIGRHPVEMNLRDRVIVRDGRMVDRAAKGLPLGVTLAILRTPSVWRRAAKLLVRVRWSAPAVR
jgi:hypothetical protein